MSDYRNNDKNARNGETPNADSTQNTRVMKPINSGAKYSNTAAYLQQRAHYVAPARADEPPAPEKEEALAVENNADVDRNHRQPRNAAPAIEEAAPVNNAVPVASAENREGTPRRHRRMSRYAAGETAENAQGTDEQSASAYARPASQPAGVEEADYEDADVRTASPVPAPPVNQRLRPPRQEIPDNVRRPSGMMQEARQRPVIRPEQTDVGQTQPDRMMSDRP
ncbi:MAG: hypothetical protein PHD67_11000, partial [Oscillospiraceae bacterium]|nr:hypothetical protein [Oscillospiraceae bacterium]